MANMVRAELPNGAQVTVSRAHAEARGWQVLEHKPALDRNGRALAAKQPAPKQQEPEPSGKKPKAVKHTVGDAVADGETKEESA